MAEQSAMSREAHTAAMDGLARALAAYDERYATCPLNSKDPGVRDASRQVCRACGQGQDGSCLRDNPWPVVEAARAAIHSATGEG